jgi:hypothetical protein
MPRQVGDGAGELEHAMMRPCREVQLAHSRLHEVLAGTVERAVCPHLGRPYVGVGQQARALEALSLTHARRGDPLAHRAGRLAQALDAELLVLDARHLDMDVDAVEQRIGDTLLVACDNCGRASAAFLRVQMPTTRAGMETNCTF